MIQAGVDKLHEPKATGKLQRQVDGRLPIYEKDLAEAKRTANSAAAK